MGMDLIEGQGYDMIGGDTSLIRDFIDLGGSVTADVANALEKTSTPIPTPAPTRTV